MNRYRIRLQTDRVIGPVNVNEIKELILKKKIIGNEKVQTFPNGDWVNLKTIEELSDLFSGNIEASKDETHLLNLKEFDLTSEEESSEEHIEQSEVPSEMEKHEEFKFKHEDPFEDESTPKTNDVESVKDSVIKEEVEEKLKKERTYEIDDGIDRSDGNDSTRVRTINKPISEVSEDKTQINPEYKKYLEEIELEKKKKEEEDKRKAEIEIEEIPTDYENEATQMLDLSDIRNDLKEAVVVEEEYSAKESEKRKKEKQLQREALKKLESENDNEDDDSTDKEGLRSKIIAGIVVVFIIWFGFFEEEDDIKGELKVIKLSAPYIVFPARYEVDDEAKAKELYSKGILEHRKFTYPASNKAAKYFFSSTENMFENNIAVAKLIFLYSHNLINSNERKDDSNAIFKLVQIFETKSYSDPNFASAIAYFYYSVGKYEASIRTFDKYITLNGKVATPELFSVRLMALIKAGMLIKAQKTAKKLASIKNKDLFTLNALYMFYQLQEQYPEMEKTLAEALRVYPNNVSVLLKKGMVFVEQENLKGLKEIIYKLNSLNVEGSKIYYSKYLTLKGMYHAFKKNIKQATKEFKKSLELYPSIELISKLASLSEATDKETNNLILTSRARKHIHSGRIFLNNNDLKSAFKEGLDASNIAPDFIEARIFMSELQMKSGFIKDAIVQLEKLYKDNPSSIDILFALIDAYTEAYKFRKVETLLTAAQNIAGNLDYKFYSAKAKYSLLKGDLNSASGWLQRSINANPLDDKNVFELAKLYIRYHDYTKGKITLKKAMTLDPANVDYRIYFAKILYELETSNAAIGYLYDVLKDFPDNPKILSEIGIYFYRSGQLKKYKVIKKKLLGLPEKDVSLFKFLIETARLDDDIEKQISYSEDLIELKPGDLKVRMDLANTYINLQRYKKAKKHIDMINDRLDSYPRLQYLNAKLYYLVDDLEKSKVLVKKEIAENPTVIDGYILLADIYIKEKNLLAARKEYMKAVQLKPNNVEAIMGIAFVALNSDQYDMALDQYQKAIELDPNRADTYKLLGDAYRKLGQSQYAIKNYKHFLELSPNSKYKNGIQTYIRTMQ